MSQVANGHQMTATAPAKTNFTHASPALESGHGYTNGNVNSSHSFENEKSSMPHQAPTYNGGGNGGQYLSRTLTPGGHFADDDLIAIASSHRRIGNPLPLGVLSFSTSTLLLSLYNIQVRGITIPNAVLGLALAYGGLSQFLAGLWEFACGNTFGATVFCSFGMFWWGYAVILIPFFGFYGEYNGQAGIYTAGSAYAAEAENAIGLYLWIWFGVTTVYLVASLRGSVSLFALIFLLWFTFLFLGAHAYTGNAHLQTAGGAFGIATAFAGYYLGLASFLTPYNSFFTLPVIPLGKKE
ncbi:related to ATO2 - putative transmembrane protein involved in export of ammonia [Melanopsichium pennsylvanicum]|uniref:Possible transmembrane sensor transporter n=2 Tax=Melanopsichium pennsylvanicum TaxID=63383 RepID=A0A077RAX8_9BASI|nr:possible transmembrane sensor transporter [Melanopsichium pennsylvanicum 4]SNX87789.1 related to ATO2 - putative transmembrane protein involved in export of ammonia [Melanopsichium pennsylvanicum]